jgi:hypothetical protein
MRLDWNDIRARAAKFAEEWKDAHYERGESQTFYNEFFELFGVTRKRVASFEHGVALPDNKHGFLDLFWKGKLLIEQKSKGRDLKPARRQALDYFPGLKESDLPRYILLSDFQNFELYDLELAPDTPVRFRLSELPDHVQAFGFIVGQERRIFRDQDPANIQASEMMGALHDALEESGYRDHALERFLVRLLFCLFADDTGIFQPLGIFEDYVKNTREDGADVGPALGQLFQVLNTDDPDRQTTLSDELKQFSYINGDLFQESLPLPSFNRDMREKLLNVCGFRWEIISPAIFGALFQSVMDKAERRKTGGHYTSEKNILKVIEPLFMDELKNEFEQIKSLKRGRDKALEEFHTKLGSLTFFDPACGCGNFLVIAYRELRDLEIAVIKERFEETFNRPGMTRSEYVFDAASLAKINVDQFYGIELEEFPARIAEVAMWMTDHIMNVKLSAAFGKAYARIPLKASPRIRNSDALEVDWADVLPPEKCSYVFGNPPFIGAKVQSEKQRAQVRRIAALGGSGGSLDYVCAWLLKAGEYLRLSNAKIAFVATNSITQGEQVAQLWSLLFDRYKLEIAFAHRTFRWLSDARGMAHVHCVIVGLVHRGHEPKEKRLYSYNEIDGDPVESRHAVLSPYLFDASRLQNHHLVVTETTKNLSHVDSIVFGNMPNDGGHLILSSEERDALLAEHPSLSKFVRQLIGADDLINGAKRYCLWLVGAEPEIIRNNLFIKDRVRLTAEYRKNSRRAATQRLAETPYLFGEIRQTGGPFAIIPRHSSETRQYVSNRLPERRRNCSRQLSILSQRRSLEFRSTYLANAHGVATQYRRSLEERLPLFDRHCVQPLSLAGC